VTCRIYAVGVFMYDRLSSVLRELGEKDLQIERAFVLQIGAIGLKVSPDPSPNDYKKYLASFGEKITERLKQNPNIFDVKMRDSTSIGLRVTHDCAFFTGPVLEVRVNLPSRLHKFRLFGQSLTGSIEEFNVILNGSLYGAYARIQDYPRPTYIGAEFRELLILREKEPDPDFVSVGPSPIHVSFCFVVTRPDESKPSVGARQYDEKFTTFFVLDDPSRTDQEIVEEFMSRIILVMSSFYSAMTDRLDLIDRYSTLIQRHFDISNVCRMLFKIPWWRFLRANRELRTAEERIAELHCLYLEFQMACLSRNARRNGLLDDVRNHRMLRNRVKYFEEHTETETEIPEAFSSALSFFEEQVRSHRGIRSNVIVGIIGLAGVILGSVLTMILSGRAP